MADSENSDAWNAFLADVRRRPLVDHDALLVLFERFHSGDIDARDQIADANLRLVVGYALRWRRSGMDLMDLVQFGNLGLLRAIEKFDPAKGFKFSTYATWWIRQSIQRGVANTGDTIRIPIHARREAKETGDSLPGVVQSVDAPVSEDGDISLLDFLEDPSAPPDDAHDLTEIQEIVHRVLEQMEGMETADPRETIVLRHRFGIGTNECQTLDDVGEILGVTRERIRQIQMSAKKKFARQLKLANPDLWEAVKLHLDL